MERVFIDSNVLFGRPGFVVGFGGVLDPSGSALIYNSSPSEVEADKLALASDWANVGRDIENATKISTAEAEAAKG